MRRSGKLIFDCRESGVIEDDSFSGDFDNFPEGKVNVMPLNAYHLTSMQLVNRSLYPIKRRQNLKSGGRE